MCNHKRIAIIGFLIMLLLVFISSPAFCKPPEQVDTQIIIVPTEATLTIKEQLQFKVEVRNENGENIDLAGTQARWEVLGNIGNISPNGLFLASDKPGRGMVRVNLKIQNKQMTAYSLVKIAQGEMPSEPRKRMVVIVKPGSAKVPPGGAQEFVVEPAGDVQWRIIPPRIGSMSVDASGNSVFIAGQNSGKGIIVATVQTGDAMGTGRANILVGEGESSSQSSKLKLHIEPKHTRVDLGGSATFEVEVTGLDTQFPLEWGVSPGGLGHIEISGNKVTFVAGDKEGRGLITAKLRTETEIGMDWVTVDVGRTGKAHSARFRVRVAPDESSVELGGSMPFSVHLDDDVGVQPVWSVAPKKIGTIDGNGLFNATAPGWGLVIAKVDTGEGIGVGQAKVFVGTGASKPVRVNISPEKLEITIDSNPVKLIAQITDIQGKEIAEAQIQWKVIPSNMGSIDQTGMFTPGGKAGQVLVTARVEGTKGGGMAQARVTITTRERVGGRLGVSVAGLESLEVGNVYEYTVSVRDSEAKLADIQTLQYDWRIVPSKLGIIAGTGNSVIFTPSMAGRGVIIVEVKGPQGTGTGRISVTVDKK